MPRIMSLAALLLIAFAEAAAADPIVLQLHGPAQFRFAGYYAALWQGFYAESGLEVSILPGPQRGQAAALDAAREVAEGRAQFGTGTAELIIRATQGQPLLLLAPVFQQSGAAIYYRAEADFASPAALAKAKLGRPPPSDILDIELVTALRAEGIDPVKLKSVPLGSGDAVAALSDHSVDAAIGSAWEAPWLARDKTLALKSFNPADYRVEFYGDMLFTTQRLARMQPETVRRFRAAALKGWEYALQHPEEIAGRLVATLPRPAGIADAAGFARYQAEVARRLARFPDIPLGHSNPERWNRIEGSLLAAGAVLRIVEPDRFVYDIEAAPPSPTDWWIFAILGAAVIAGVIGAALAWRRWGAWPARIPFMDVAPPVTSPAPIPEPPVHSSPAAADLNALLHRLQPAIRHRLPRGVGFRLSLLPALWRCHSDPQTLRRLTLDLVAAAAADLEAGGELIIGTRNFAFDQTSAAAISGASIGEYARLTVRDSGAGLSDAALAQVFDPAATPRPAVAAAADAMRGLGGFARVESAEGVGTAVHLYFPRAVDAAPTAPVKADKPAEAAE
jgi:ABC-type nitrate/sulfonate/bicarbonate transport system substrate-binding protein